MKLNFAKKIMPLICAFVFGLSLTGCHGKPSSSGFEIPESLDSSAEYELTFWAKNDTNKAQTKIYEKAISDFEKLYPNVHIKLRLYTDYGKIYNDVITNISTNTTPNICITYPDHIATYLTGRDTVVPLDDLFADEKYGLGGSELKYDGPKIDEIVPEFLSECKIGDTYYALPYMRSTECLYVNRDYVEKLGYKLPDVITWDFIWEVSEKALEKNSDGTFKLNGQNVLIPFIYKSTDNMMIQMLRQQNADYSDRMGNILLFNDVTKADLLNIAQHVRSGAFSTFKISGYPANFLNAGQCIFAVDSSAGATWMGSKAPLSDIAEDKILDFETEVYPVPQFTQNPGDKGYTMISQGPSLCIFNKEDKQEVLYSFIFMQYLLTNEVQIAYAETEGYVPVTTKAQDCVDYQDYLSRQGEDNSKYYDVKLKATKLLLENQQYTFVTDVFNGSASLRDAAGGLIENVTKSERRHKEVDEAYIDDLYGEMTSLYHLDQTSATGGTKADLGELPMESRLLIRGLILIWLCIILYFAKGYLGNIGDRFKNVKKISK
ncbi:ABC transporter substrate-binding protein [Butyrivibrio sp. NC2002]|uniref:ABC transporter substrate-binding protein n=1 Tax=Butyrivibrio sp. NC2002 TaxID=1410610 RepID=UPI000689E980|nr:extracellular solute-binding protein [Butyrivibrio sp. NC2002]